MEIKVLHNLNDTREQSCEQYHKKNKIVNKTKRGKRGKKLKGQHASIFKTHNVLLSSFVSTITHLYRPLVLTTTPNYYY